MLTERPKAKEWDGHHFMWMQPKFDGRRTTLEVDSLGSVGLWGRKLEPHLEMCRSYGLDEHPDVQAAIQWAKPGTILDGELWVPDHDASDVITFVKDPDQWDKLRWTIFAVPMFKNKDLRAHDVVEAYEQCGLERTSDDNPINLIQPTIKHDRFDIKHVVEFNQNPHPIESWLLAHKAEGLVFKFDNWRTWWKWKPTRTIDCVVLGFKPGEGKFLGNTGAIVVGVYNDHGDAIEIASVSGMDDYTRDMIDEDDDLGRVCEVKYQYVGAGGRLRHPRFSRWRDDEKEPKECTTDQLTDAERRRVNGV